MVYTVSRNCDERYEEFTCWDEFERYKETIDEQKKFDQEYSRLFHNCVTAIYSLINHTQRSVSKYGNEGFQDRYALSVRDPDSTIIILYLSKYVAARENDCTVEELSST